MRMEQRTVWIAHDGKEFDTQRACELHEIQIELEAAADNDLSGYNDDIVAWLIDNRVFVRELLTRYDQALEAQS